MWRYFSWWGVFPDLAIFGKVQERLGCVGLLLQAWQDQDFSRISTTGNGVVKKVRACVLQKLPSPDEKGINMPISTMYYSEINVFRLQVKRFYVVNHVKLALLLIPLDSASAFTSSMTPSREPNALISSDVSITIPFPRALQQRLCNF